MKLIKLLLIILSTSALVVSCKKTEAKTNLEKTSQNKVIAVAKAPAVATLGIEGMTCAVGCAKTIEQDLSKMPGVQKAVVDFETKIATVDYDASLLSTDNLSKTIMAAADGKTYSVVSIK